MDGSLLEIDNPTKFPDVQTIKEIEEPIITALIMSTDEFVGAILKLVEDKRGIQKGFDTTEEVLSRTAEVIELEGAKTIAAIIVEPVTGTNGILIPPDGYLQGLRDLCDKHGILLIADEVMAGFGRTGEWFSIDNWKVEPDLITMAKSLTGGLPMAAVTGRAEIMDTPASGQLGGTFSGNPASCAAALAVLDMIEKENLNARANVLGERFRKRATKWKSQWDLVGDVRGLGAMQAIELVRSQSTRQPADEETKQVAQYCYEHGLVLITAGTYGNVIRLLMPLVVTDSQMDEAMDVLEGALASVAEKKGMLAAQSV